MALKVAGFDPKEYLWDELDRRVRHRQPESKLLDQLSQELQHEC